jgi:formylglycine-generating enzyme required for sulfatase activity
VHCCWPGQHFDARVARCIGEREHCPEGASRLGHHDCAPAIGPRQSRPRAGIPRGAVWVPGGTFAMDRGGDRIVTVEPFAIDRTEVTVSAYAACVHAGRCDPAHDAFGPAHRDAPRTDVTFAMARTYCGFVGGRLPTEAEWELAARGYDRRDYPWGARLPDCTLARFAGCGERPAAAGALANGASPFGARDMAGNVAEWVADRAGALTWSSEWNPTGATRGRRRVVRGGSFADNPAAIRASARRSVDPDEARFDVGFRCVY